MNFGSNDYLGLSWNPELRRAATHATESVLKLGSGASPLITGHTQAHADLIKSLSQFEGTESAIVFSSGYAANLGTVASLATKEDILFSDSLNHASLIDGCRLSRAQVLVYPHGDPVALRELVRAHRNRGRFAFVVSDSVFSMDGDLAPLAELDSLCHEYDMQCILDEAHATGVYGDRGCGLAEHLSLTSTRIISVGTLSKAMGCVGGFVAGSSDLIDWLTNHARSWIYSTASTISNVAAASMAVQLVQQMSAERIALRRAAVDLRTKLTGLGFEVGEGDSPIVPIYINNTHEVLRMSERLALGGSYVPAIRPPTVPENRSLLRVSLSVMHSQAEITQLISNLSSL